MDNRKENDGNWRLFDRSPTHCFFLLPIASHLFYFFPSTVWFIQENVNVRAIFQPLKCSSVSMYMCMTEDGFQNNGNSYQYA